MEFSWTAEQQELRARARKVAEDAVERFGRHNDSWINGFSREFSRELAAHGWIGMTWPVEHGGGGRPPIERLIVAEEMISAGAPIAASWFADRQMGPALMTYGTADQVDQFLPRILSGETTWCIGMSEPEAGSDLAALKTRAVRDGDDFVINGQKIWTSFAEVADYCYLICRTSTEGPPHAGISEVIVPMDTPGIEVRPIQDMTTNRHFCEVFYTDVRVPVANLVGVEGAAFKQTMRQLEHERGGIDRLVSNRALYLMALDRADRTDPLVRQEIARLETGLPAGPPAGHPGGAGPGADRLQRGHQVLLHRARVAGGGVRRPRARPRRDVVGSPGPRADLRAGLHDHGRDVERDAQHPGRAHVGPASGAEPPVVGSAPGGGLPGVLAGSRTQQSATESRENRSHLADAGLSDPRPGPRGPRPGREPRPPGSSRCRPSATAR